MNEFDSGDEFAVYDTSANTTGKMTIANVLGTSITGLGTTATTIPGAISELNTGLGSVNTLLGSGDISSIGDGSVTGAISSLNNDLVHKSGDTMTGNLIITKSQPVYYAMSSNINSTIGQTIPSSDTEVGSFVFRDLTPYTCGWMASRKLTSDTLRTELVCRRKDASETDITNILYLGITSSGNRYVTVSEAAPWLTALGLNNLLQSKQYTYAYTIAASSRLDITVSNFNISTPSGYTPFGFSYINTGSQHVFPVTISPNATASSSNILTLKNTATTSVNATATIRVLYIKTGFYNALN